MKVFSEFKLEKKQKNGFGRDEEEHRRLNLLGGGSNGTQVKLMTVIKMEGS